MIATLLLAFVPVADDSAALFREFQERQGLTFGEKKPLRARGFLESNVYSRTRWYAEVLATSTTARATAKLTEDQTRAADKLAASIKIVGVPEIEAPSPLTAEAVKFLGPEQRRWLVTLIVWTEGLFSLRHPLVCTEIGVDEPTRRRIWERVRRDEKAAGKPWAKLLDITRFRPSEEETGNAARRLFELTLAFESEVWMTVLSEKDRLALLALPAYDGSTTRAIQKEIRFIKMMALGETADGESVK